MGISIWEQSCGDVRLQSSMRGPRRAGARTPRPACPAQNPRAEAGEGLPRPWGGRRAPGRAEVGEDTESRRSR